VRLILGGVIFGGHERLVAQCGRAERYIASWLASDYRHVDWHGIDVTMIDVLNGLSLNCRVKAALDRDVAARPVALQMYQV
jgi:hypothetical protein